MPTKPQVIAGPNGAGESTLAPDLLRFAFETTPASRSYGCWIGELKSRGYGFHLIYLWLRTPELAVERVEERVRLGGHDVPEETIRRRYRRGLRNFFTLFMPLADTRAFYDSSEAGDPIIVATGNGQRATVTTAQRSTMQGPGG